MQIQPCQAERPVPGVSVRGLEVAVTIPRACIPQPVAPIAKPRQGALASILPSGKGVTHPLHELGVDSDAAQPVTDIAFASVSNSAHLPMKRGMEFNRVGSVNHWCGHGEKAAARKRSPPDSSVSEIVQTGPCSGWPVYSGTFLIATHRFDHDDG